MYTEAIIVIEIVIVLLSVCSSALTVRRVKKQISEISDTLEDIKNGNGNRRILAETHEFVAPLAYAINDIILSYEKRLSACHQTDEANRQLTALCVAIAMTAFITPCRRPVPMDSLPIHPSLAPGNHQLDVIILDI